MLYAFGSRRSAARSLSLIAPVYASDDEAACGFGHDSPVIVPHRLGFEHRYVPTSPQQPAFEIDPHTHRQRLAIAYVGPRRSTAFAAKKDPVGHYIVEQAEENAAVGNAFITDTLVVRRELRATYFTVQAKANAQTTGIARTAHETPVGGGFQGHGAPYHSRVLPMTDIKARLAAHQPTRFEPERGTRQAAVAIVLRERADDTDVLLIKRAERKATPGRAIWPFPVGTANRRTPISPQPPCARPRRRSGWLSIART